EAAQFAPGTSHASWRANVDALESFARGRNKVFSKAAATTLLPPVAVDPGQDRPFVLAPTQAGGVWLAHRTKEGSIATFRKAAGLEGWTKGPLLAQGGDVPAAAGTSAGWMVTAG